MGSESKVVSNEDFEKAVLGYCLRFPETASSIIDGLKEDDFSSQKNRSIFKGIKSLDAKGSPIDLLILSEKSGLPVSELLEFQDPDRSGAFNGISIDFYKNQIKAFSKRRKLQVILEQQIKDPSVEFPTIASSIKELLEEGEGWSGGGSKGVALGHVYDAQRMIREYEKYVSDLDKINFRTGINPIDRKIRGVAGGEVLTIVARAGSFKTATLQNMLINYIQNSAWGVAFFSLEMPVPSLTERFHEMISQYPGSEVEEFYRSKHFCLEEIQKELVKGLSKLFVVPVKVSIKQIPEYTSLIEKHFRTKIGVVGIDYLGLIDAQGPNQYEIVSRLARGIKGLAKEINLPVILLTQVSRKGGSGETEITLDMGRDSGAIEEAADFVIGLFQSEKGNPLFEASDPEYDLIAKILKNRKGPKNSMWKLSLDPSTLRLGHEAEAWTPPKKNSRRIDL